MCTADASAAHRPFSPIFPVVDFRGEKGLWTRDYSADRSNPQSDFYGKGPLFLERVTGRRQEFTEGVPVAPLRSGASAWYRGIFLGFHSARISRS